MRNRNCFLHLLLMGLAVVGAASAQRLTTNQQATPILHAAGFGPFYPCLPDGYRFHVDDGDIQQDIRYGVTTNEDWVVLIAKLRILTPQEAQHPEQLLPALQAANPHHRSSRFQIDREDHRENGYVRTEAWLSLWVGIENGKVTPDSTRAAVAGIFDTIRATQFIVWRER